MDSQQFAEYLAEYSIEPWGEARADLRSGILGAVIAACHGKKNAKPADYMPKFDTEPKKQSAEEMAAVFNAFRRF